MQINAFIISLIAATLVNGLLAYFSWKRRTSKASKEAFLLLIAITVWSFFAVFEAASTTVSYKVLFGILTYIGITAVPALFLIFACRYVHFDKWLTKKNTPFLRQVIEKAVIPFSAKAREKDLELNLLISADIPQIVSGDPVRLRQIINNLISNAIKFTEKGNIFLEASLKRQTELELELLFKVEDTGIGIEKELINKLFKPFTQADASSTRKYGGTGLGLSICKNLVGMMGGDINVYSRPGNGSTFVFTVTMKKTKDYIITEPPDYSGLKGKKILIVDDNAMNRKIAKTYLQETGCIIEEAKAGPEALDKIIRNVGMPVFDAVVLDYQMPGMSGTDIMAALKAIPSTKNIPLVLATSVSSDIKPDEAISCGFSGYLLKPYRRNELLECMALAVKGKIYQKNNIGIIAVNETQKGLDKKPGTEKRTEILLVEDNVINKLFFTKLLESRNLHCDVAANGVEAIEACNNNDYSIIFMDCQMPVMDGYEATKNIREKEKAKGNNKHTIIVAMTAYATKEDEQKCLNSGMDMYLSKPVNINEVINIISKEGFVEKIEQNFGNNENIEQNSGSNDFSGPQILFEKINRDIVFLKDILEKFKLNSSELLNDISAAIQTGDRNALKTTVHSLKGTLSVFHAEKCTEIVKRLEDAGKSDNVNAALSIFKELKKELRLIISNFENFIKNNTDSYIA